MTTRRRLLVSLALSVIALSACAGAPPDVAAWEARWHEVRAMIPPLEAFADGPDESRCESVLVELREARNRLLPAPDPLLSAAVDEWLQHAETIFFECPPETGTVVGFDEAYAELARLEREIRSLVP